MCNVLDLYNKLHSHVFSLHFTDTEGDAGGSNTVVIVVAVIAIICLLGAASVFLVMKYKAKSLEVTPSAQKQELGPHVKPRAKKKKHKHSSSTTGMGEGPEAVKAAAGRGADQKK